ncbi:MAG: O-methyltransferase [Pyrinomonadaceae bacterium]
MSGANVPYHLRQNKAVDRNLFIELLNRLNRYKSIEEYTYISFGGSFLEDFKLVHAHTGIGKMISLEADKNVYERQKFNMPINCIEPLCKKSGEFISNHSFDGKNIVWLDYASPSEMESQLGETEYLITQLYDFDIVKITLNANANTLADSRTMQEVDTKLRLQSTEIGLKKYKNELIGIVKKFENDQPIDIANVQEKIENEIPRTPSSNLNKIRLEKFQSRIGKYVPSGIVENDMRSDAYPHILCRTLKTAIQQGMKSKPRSYFQPLAAFSYADSEHTMLTYTGIILSNEKDEIERFFLSTKLKNWDLFDSEGEKATNINVPALSLKERLAIDSMLPNSDEKTIQAGLGFLFSEDEAISLNMLKNYIKFYKQYPIFLKMSV